jgi:hypothetical protein
MMLLTAPPGTRVPSMWERCQPPLCMQGRKASPTPTEEAAADTQFCVNHRARSRVPRKAISARPCGRLPSPTASSITFRLDLAAWACAWAMMARAGRRFDRWNDLGCAAQRSPVASNRGLQGLAKGVMAKFRETCSDPSRQRASSRQIRPSKRQSMTAATSRELLNAA